MIATRTTARNSRDEHGTPLFVVDHDELRRNYATFKKYLPRVQAYYAVKANPDPAIVKTLYKAGAQLRRGLHARVPDRPREHQGHARQGAAGLDLGQDHLRQPHQGQRDAAASSTSTSRWSPTTTSRRSSKIKQHAPHAGLALRLKVPNTGAMVELSSKFGAAPGEAVDLILAADKAGLVVEGLSFHVGSQTTNFENYVQAINLAANIFKEAQRPRLHQDEPARHRRRLPRALRRRRSSRSANWPRIINRELDRLFPKDIEILAEPGRFMVATAATAVSKIIGKAVRDGKLCYYINDGVYHTFSGIIFDHCHYHLKSFKQGPDADLLRVRPDLRRARRGLAWPRTCPPTSSSATCSTARTSAPTATPPPPTSTASRRRRWCTSTSDPRERNGTRN